MPKLILLVACEKVIIDRAELPSAISIFQSMKLQLADAPPPADAVAPQRWAIFSMWRHGPNEKDIAYIQHTEIVRPNGEVFGVPSQTSFKVTGDDAQSKIYIDVMGLPIGEPGMVKIRVWLQDIPESAAEYEFSVVYLPKETNEQTTAPTSVN